MSLDEIFTSTEPGPEHRARPLSETVQFKQLAGPKVIVRPINHKDPAEIEALFKTTDESTFIYMWYGPFPNLSSFTEGLIHRSKIPGWTSLVWIDRETGYIVGSGAYHRVDLSNRTVELGGLWIGKDWAGKGLALEAIALMTWQAIKHWGFVRVEWKTHHLNIGSQKLAERAGLTLEGRFRKHMYYKGASRDTFWYAVIDDDYADVEAALLNKLKPIGYRG
ncbi:hypothetical protein HK097_000975 [Rhizophlyctis rosea]|uniref:N-acetyltransferase domain-containing protein n=1 Tax=Rhizophlyctis rosea TaxID=64517 RepID=A0AAD5SH70_9FUNG|nr:hypothetical protein HK097_000975 [Rhizophlyctis rosea]